MGTESKQEIREKSIRLRMERDQLTEDFKNKVEEANQLKEKVLEKSREIDEFISSHRYLLENNQNQN